VVCGLVWSLALSQHAIAQTGGRAQGRIEGKIVRQDGGAGVGGVTVVVEELGRAELTDADGTYAFQRVPPGTYTVLATLGPQSVRERVTVTGPNASAMVAPSRIGEAPTGGSRITVPTGVPAGTDAPLEPRTRTFAIWIPAGADSTAISVQLHAEERLGAVRHHAVHAAQNGFVHKA